jgi:hypothetical protein
VNGHQVHDIKRACKPLMRRFTNDKYDDAGIIYHNLFNIDEKGTSIIYNLQQSMRDGWGSADFRATISYRNTVITASSSFIRDFFPLARTFGYELSQDLILPHIFGEMRLYRECMSALDDLEDQHQFIICAPAPRVIDTERDFGLQAQFLELADCVKSDLRLFSLFKKRWEALGGGSRISRSAMKHLPYDGHLCVVRVPKDIAGRSLRSGKDRVG